MNKVRFLTKAQKECLRLIALGYSDKAICKMKHIAQGTLNYHRGSIYNDLEIFANEEDVSPRVLAAIKYWQDNIEELKEINLDRGEDE